MAKLTTYTGQLQQGSNAKISVSVAHVTHHDVGSGTLPTLNDFEVSFNGKVSVLGYKFSVSVDVALPDHDPNAPSGPCTISIAGQTDDNASYKVSGSKLVISAYLFSQRRSIDVSTYEGGTRLSGDLPYYVNWVDIYPASRAELDTLESDADNFVPEPLDEALVVTGAGLYPVIASSFVAAPYTNGTKTATLILTGRLGQNQVSARVPNPDPATLALIQQAFAAKQNILFTVKSGDPNVQSLLVYN